MTAEAKTPFYATASTTIAARIGRAVSRVCALVHARYARSCFRILHAARLLLLRGIGATKPLDSAALRRRRVHSSAVFTAKGDPASLSRRSSVQRVAP